MTNIDPKTIGMSGAEIENLEAKTKETVKDIEMLLKVQYGKNLSRHNAKKFVDDIMNQINMIGNFIEENETNVISLSAQKQEYLNAIKTNFPVNTPQLDVLLKPGVLSEAIAKKFYTSICWRAVREWVFVYMKDALLSVIESEKGMEIAKLNIEAMENAYKQVFSKYEAIINNQQNQINKLMGLPSLVAESDLPKRIGRPPKEEKAGEEDE